MELFKLIKICIIKQILLYVKMFRNVRFFEAVRNIFLLNKDDHN